MSFNFTRSAQEQTSLSKLMIDREQMTTADVNGKTLTIVGFDLIPKKQNGETVVDPETGEVDTYAVITFKEFPKSYYNCGMVFSGVCKSWRDAFAGDIDAANTELVKQGGVKARFVPGKTKQGRDVTNVVILG